MTSICFFFSSRRRHTRSKRDWSSDVCSSDLGLYGTLAYRVDRRTSEIGVRIALGAQHGQVLWLILRESLLVSGAAILAGVPVAIAGARLMRSMLFGVQPGDVL